MTTNPQSARIALPSRYHSLNQRLRPWSPIQLEIRQRVLDHISLGHYSFVAQPCPCGEHDDVVIATTERHSLPHRTVICRQCGLLRTDPRLSDESYADFYSNYYTLLYGGLYTFTEEIFDRLAAEGERLARWIEPFFEGGSDKVVLEIGCGSGAKLKTWHRPGCLTVGYDYGGQGLEYGKKEVGLDLRIGSTKTAIQDGQKCDLLILSHVVEHFGDVVMSLKELHPLLKPTTRVYVEVPSVWQIGMQKNTDPLFWFRLAHVWSFCFNTLEYVMNLSGYELVAGDEIYNIRSIWQPNLDAADSDLHIGPHLSLRIIRHIQMAERRRQLLSPLLWVCNFGRACTLQATQDLGIYELLRRMYHWIKK